MSLREVGKHFNSCFLFTFYFALAFIKTSGSLEWAICERSRIKQNVNANPQNVHSAPFHVAAALGCFGTVTPHCTPKLKLSLLSRVLVLIMYINSKALFRQSCLLWSVFQNYEPSISISFLINAIPPLFNHIAYRHVLKSQLKKQLEIQSGVCFELSLWTMMCLNLWKGEVIINITFGIHHSVMLQNTAPYENWPI